MTIAVISLNFILLFWKNYHVVRRHIGYGRFEIQQTVDLFNQYYELLDLRINFFDTHYKIISKKRNDSTVKKRYAESKTAYHRVLADPSVSQDRKDNLTDIYYSINPVILNNGMITLK